MSGRDKSNRKYLNSYQIILAGCMLILLSLACNMPLMARQEDDSQLKQPGFVETSIAETMAALGRQPDAEDQSDQVDEDIPPTATFTPDNTETSTQTPTVTETPTLTPTVTDTPTPEVPWVYISENTNCRSGPGKVYDWLITVQQGQEAEAVAKDPLDQYWYIRRPDQESAFCWLWGRYATPEGNTASLPVFTPPPTPTPSMDFSISYHSNIGLCGAVWVLQYRVDNIGAFTFESWKTTETDHTGGSNPQDTQDNTFFEFGGCAPVNVQVDLTPGEASYVMARFNNDPQGHDITTKIRLCTENGLGGECLVKTFRHTP